MKSSKALKIAYAKLLEAEKTNMTFYLCPTLEYLHATDTNIYKNLSEVFAQNAERTSGKPYTISDFLRSHKIFLRNEELYEYRKQWILWLIPQYEAKGD